MLFLTWRYGLMADSVKMYKLLGADGKEYLSETPGTLGGNDKQKIYGRLDCGTTPAETA